MSTARRARHNIIGSESGMVSLLHKHMREFGLQNELLHHHCIMQQQILICEALRFKQIITDVVTAANIIR
jgi:hypothetical protein